MSRRTLKLGAVLLGVGGPGQHNTWLDPEIPGDASVDVRWYIARAQEAEAAKFDHVFIVDSQFITPDSPNHYLSRLEPLTLLSAIAVHTSHIGLVGTLTTSYNEPFNVARRLASLDHISGGRAGWNVVTSGDAGTAGNYSRDEHYDYADPLRPRAGARAGRAGAVGLLRGRRVPARQGARRLLRPRPSSTRSTTRASTSRSSARSTSSARRRASR